MNDMLLGIHELGLKDITEEDLLLIFRRYDTDQDGTIRFSEFSHAFVPLQPEHQTYLFERKPKSLKAPFKEHMFTYKAKKVLVAFL